MGLVNSPCGSLELTAAPLEVTRVVLHHILLECDRLHRETRLELHGDDTCISSWIAPPLHLVKRDQSVPLPFPAVVT